MASETGGGAAAGAAQGAAAGAAFGPWGALVGAVIGGAVGYFSGAEKKLAKKYGKKAAAVRRQQQTMQLAIQRRDLVRQSRMARAQAVSAGASESGVRSSAVTGATSSLDSQTTSALAYFDTQVANDNLYQQFAAKAGKHAQRAAGMDSILGSAAGVAGVGADIYGSLKTTPTVSSSTSFNATAAQYNMNKNPAFSTFGSSLNLGP